MQYLGEDMADFIIENGERPVKDKIVAWKMGSSYATSYPSAEAC